MSTINAAREALKMIPARLSDNGRQAVAYYLYVPHDAFDPSMLTPTDTGFDVHGFIDDCAFAGQAIEGSDGKRFRRVILTFTLSAGDSQTFH